MKQPDYLCYTDGGARGNPGPSGIGVLIQNSSGATLLEESKFLGVATNNHAEYEALVFLAECFSHITSDVSAVRVRIHLDSELVVKQLLGLYKVKDANLKLQNMRAREAFSTFGSVEFVHVPREKNKVADRLANEAMDRGA